MFCIHQRLELAVSVVNLGTHPLKLPLSPQIVPIVQTGVMKNVQIQTVMWLKTSVQLVNQNTPGAASVAVVKNQHLRQVQPISVVNKVTHPRRLQGPPQIVANVQPGVNNNVQL